jgi:hypothetical protein
VLESLEPLFLKAGLNPVNTEEEKQQADVIAHTAAVIAESEQGFDDETEHDALLAIEKSV